MTLIDKQGMTKDNKHIVRNNGYSELDVLAVEKSLTDREADVLREYVSGKNRTEISKALYISESTVKNHISNIFSKLGVKNKTELLNLLNSSKEDTLSISS